MKRSLLLLLLVLFFGKFGFTQSTGISGNVSDKITGEPLIGVNVVVLKGNTKDSTIINGTTTDFDGNYYVELKSGTYIIEYQYVGFETYKRTLKFSQGNVIQLNVALNSQAELIDEVVVSAGKFEQKISDVTVSMEVLKPKAIENSNDFNVSTAVNKIPGVDVSDKQASIRGSSGWSYGAGTRVMILMDDLPIISADVGDVKWNFIPVENISQVEVIKGASSALFGSSALGGVINIRSAYPKSKPETKLNYFVGFYNKPKSESFIWWQQNFYNPSEEKLFKDIPFREQFYFFHKNPMYSGFSFSHAQQFGNLDLTIGGNHFVDEGYRLANYEYRARGNVNLRYRFEKVKGLALGMNTNVMAQENSDFFFWKSDTAAYEPNGTIDFTAPNQGFRMNIDPYIEYFKENGSKYSVKTRYFRTVNEVSNDSSKNSTSNLFYGDYKYQTVINDDLNITAGFTNIYSKVYSTIFGEHYSNNLAGYGQLDWRFGRLKTSLGFRAEYFRLDSAESISSMNIGDKNIPIQPVFRTGLNYQLAEYTFLRASFGQAYRFPAISEKYTASNLGGGIAIFPNPYIDPEHGWSAEVGIKQGVKLGRNWKGYADVSVFVQEINNMIEFTYGLVDSTYLPVGLGVSGSRAGFQARNVGDARIYGSEASISALGKLGPFDITLMMSYIFLEPNNKNGTDTTYSTDASFLKYRYQHSFKTDINFETEHLTFGTFFNIHSNYQNVDRFFCDERENPNFGYLFFSNTVLPGYFEYRNEHKDDIFFQMEVRVGFKFSEYIKTNIVVKNLFNSEFVGRPGDMLAPRRLEIQVNATF